MRTLHISLKTLLWAGPAAAMQRERSAAASNPQKRPFNVEDQPRAAPFLLDHGLISSMSRHDNRHDNGVAESFCHLLKRKRIHRRTYPTRDDSRVDVFRYIEMFYSSKRRQGTACDSPAEFELRH